MLKNRYILKLMVGILAVSIFFGYVFTAIHFKVVSAAEISVIEFDDRGLPQDVLESKYRNQIAQVIDLGLLEIGNDGQFGCESNVKRGELAHTAMVMLGMGNILYDSTADVYRDVDTSNLYYDEILLAAEYGVMTGYEDRTFRSDETADLNMMVKVLVTALGYGYSAEQNGGYMGGGYMQQAVSLKLFDGITSPNASKECFAAMVMNALEAPTMELVDINNGGYEKGDDLLYAGMKLKTVKGQVNTVGDVSLYLGQNGIKGNVLKIGDMEFNFSDDIPAKEYIGFEVRVYYAETDDELYIKSIRLLPNKNDVLDISADMISDKSSVTEIYYEIEDGKRTKKAEISRNADIIYNGRAGSADDVDFSADSFGAGNVRLIDCDTEGAYDVMIINKYETYIVDSVIARNDTIYTKYNGELKLNSEEIQNLYSDGINVQIGSLKEWDVLFVKRDHDGVANEILVSTEKVSGKISSVSDDMIEIDNIEYELNYHYEKDIENGTRTQMRVGDTGIFSVDPEGRIAAINYNQTADASTKYGYLIRVIPYDVETDSSKIKIYSVQDNQMALLKCADKVKLNSVTRKVQDALNDPRLYNSNGVVYQMIRYKQNAAGEVSAIDTAVNKDTMTDWIDTSKLTYEEMNMVSNRHSEESEYFDDRTFTISINGENLKLRRGNHSFGSRCYYNAASKALVIPADEEGLTDENEYAVYGMADLDERSTRTFEVYAYDDDDLNVSRIIILRGAGTTGNVDELSSVFTVSRKLAVYNDSIGDEAWELEGVIDGEKITAAPKNEDVNETFDPVSSGDIFQINIDDKNRVSELSKRFSINYMLEDLSDGVLNHLADGEEISGKPYDTFDYHVGTDESNYEHVIGRVIAVGSDRCLISTAKNGIEETAVIVYQNTTDFTVYDSNITPKSAMPGSSADIAKDMIVYARIETGFLRDVVVYLNAE